MIHIGKISTDFFAYDIKTKLTVNFPVQFPFPSIGICFYEMQLVNWDKLLQVKPNIVHELGLDLSLSRDEVIQVMKNAIVPMRRVHQGKIFADMDIKTRASVVHSSDDLFNHCHLINNDGLSQAVDECHNLFDISHYQFSYFSCFSFNLKHNFLNVSLLENFRADLKASFLYQISSNKSLLLPQVSDVEIFFNLHNTYERFGYFKAVPIAKLENVNLLSYDEYTNSRLKYPYTTKCRNYNDTANKDHHITGRSSCFERCFITISMKSVGLDVIFPGIFVFEKLTKKFPFLKSITVHELWSNQTLIKKKEEISNICDNQCSSPACDETFFVPKKLTSQKSSEPGFEVHSMQSPKIDTSCEPKLSLVGYVTNVLATFGFWIGLSIFAFIQYLTKSCREFLHPLIEYTKRKEIETISERLFFERWKEKKNNRFKVVSSIHFSIPEVIRSQIKQKNFERCIHKS